MSGSERMADEGREADAPRPRRGPDALALGAFVALVVLIAANVVAIRFTNRELPPLWGGGTRFGLAGLIFAGYVSARRLSLPRGRALAGSLLFGVLQFGLGFALGYWALLEVPAGLASIILASVPIFTFVFAVIARVEPFRVRGLIGAVVAVSGIALMSGERAGGDIPFLYLLAAVGTAASFALVPVVIKSFPDVPVAVNNAIGMLTGAVILLTLSRVTGESIKVPELPATWLAQLYLVVPGSVGVFGLLLFVLGRWTATAVSYQTVLSPIVSIALAAWLLDEPVTQGLFLGGALVLTGVYVGALAPDREPG